MTTIETLFHEMGFVQETDFEQALLCQKGTQ